jgi:hypothetical protein
MTAAGGPESPAKTPTGDAQLPWQRSVPLSPEHPGDLPGFGKTTCFVLRKQELTIDHQIEDPVGPLREDRVRSGELL